MPPQFEGPPREVVVPPVEIVVVQYCRHTPSRARHYLPHADCAAYGAHPTDMLALRTTPENVRLISDCARWARTTMQSGAPLVHRLPGRAGWELRLVVQGGLRILDKVDALRGSSLHTRPRLRPWDWCVMLGRALVM